MCETEVMHDSTSLRFKLAIPANQVVQNSIVDWICKVEDATKWVGPRPSGYLEQEAQKVLGGGKK